MILSKIIDHMEREIIELLTQNKVPKQVALEITPKFIGTILSFYKKADREIEKELEKISEMTAACKNIDYSLTATPDKRWYATMWCNTTGDFIVGYGNSLLNAVRDVHETWEKISNSQNR